MQARRLKEQEVEAKRVREATYAALKADDDDLLIGQESEIIDVNVDDLLDKVWGLEPVSRLSCQCVIYR